MSSPDEEDKYNLDYWDGFEDDGKRFVSAKSMIYYIASLTVIVQLLAQFLEPSNWLNYQLLAFIMATNLGAVLLAVKAQKSAEDISSKYSRAFNADFYHTMFLFTQIKKKIETESKKDDTSLSQEIDSLGEDVYGLFRGYLTKFNEHRKTEVNYVESRDFGHIEEDELFE